MHRQAIALCVLVAGALGSATLAGPASGRHEVTVVTVTAGKPSELGFKLSRSSLPAGPVTFKVRNAGKLVHDFKICTAPAAEGLANTCTGKATKRLAAGQSASLTVTFGKAGKYEFLSTVHGQASAGMKGLLGVAAAALPPASAIAASDNGTSSSPSNAPPAFGPSGVPCSSPQGTTVNVTAFDYGFTLSQTTMHCGIITWVETNTGNIPHNFNPNNAFSSRDVIDNPGQTLSFTQNYLPGTYQYICDVSGHIAFGMIGSFTITG